MLDIPSYETRILLPTSLRNVYDEKSNFVPSLFELSLRFLYSLYFYVEDIRECLFIGNVSYLPNELSSQFWAGPTALCQYCKVSIFTEALLWVFPREMLQIEPGSPRSFLAVMFFCSLKCTKKFRAEEIFLKDYNERLNIELIKWSIS